MQPQDPHNPSQNPQAPQGQPQPLPQADAPAPSGTPAPQSPTTPAAQPGPAPSGPQGPAASPFPQSAPGGPAPVGGHPLESANKKKKMMVVIVTIVAVLLVAAGIFFVASKMLGGVKLEQYSNNNISVLVPVGYTKVEENGGGTFEEKEGAEDTHSEVIAFHEALPSGLSEGDIEQFRGTLRTVLQQAAESSASDSGRSVENLKITDITFNGDKALKLTGDAIEKGKKVGSYTMVAGLNSKAVYMVGVGVHESDPSLGKKTNEIINSFKLKN